MADNDGRVVIEDAEIGFLNFMGREDKYNRSGARNFAVFLDAEMAEQLRRDGWNVKTSNPPEDSDYESSFYVKVNVNYRGPKPPKIVLLSSSGKSNLDESTVGMLDWAEIKKVDLIFVPYEYEIAGRTGVSAYLKSMFVEIIEDELELKYASWGQ